MGELASALDGLAADDLFSCSDADLLDRTRELVAARNRLDAELARTVRRAECVQAPEHDGLKTMGSWLRAHTRLAARVATQLIGNGRTLEALPAVAAAAAAGQVTGEQVAALAPVGSAENQARAAAQGVDPAAIEAALLAVAVSAPHHDLQQAFAAYLAALDPDGTEPDPTEGRSVTLAQHPDGSWTGRLSLDAVGGEKVATALEAIAAASRTAADDRSRAQRLGDALVQLADLALASVAPFRVPARACEGRGEGGPLTGRYAHRPRRGHHRAGHRDLRRPRPLDRLRRRRGPHRPGPRLDPDRPRPRQAHRPTDPAPRRRGPRPHLRVHRLPRPRLVVRGPQ